MDFNLFPGNVTFGLISILATNLTRDKYHKWPTMFSRFISPLLFLFKDDALPLVLYLISFLINFGVPSKSMFLFYLFTRAALKGKFLLEILLRGVLVPLMGAIFANLRKN